MCRFILIKRIKKTSPLFPEWEKDEQFLFSTLLLLPFKLSKGYRYSFVKRFMPGIHGAVFNPQPPKLTGNIRKRTNNSVTR